MRTIRNTPTTLAPSTLIILFSEMFNFKKKIQITKKIEGKNLIFKNILCAEMKISKLINYWKDMC